MFEAPINDSKPKFKVLKPSYIEHQEWGVVYYSVVWRHVGWADSMEDAKAQGFIAPVLSR